MSVSGKRKCAAMKGRRSDDGEGVGVEFEELLAEREVVHCAQQDPVVEDARADAEDGLAGAEGVVCEGEAGGEVVAVAEDGFAFVAEAVAQDEVGAQAPFVVDEEAGVGVPLRGLGVEALAEARGGAGEEVSGAGEGVGAGRVGEVDEGRVDALEVGAEFEGVWAAQDGERVLDLEARLEAVGGAAWWRSLRRGCRSGLRGRQRRAGR